MKSSASVAANRGTVSNRRAKRTQTTARVDDCTIDRSQTPTHFVHRRLSRSPFPTPRRHHSCSLPFPFPIPFPIRRLLRFIFTFYEPLTAEDAAEQRGSARARSTSRDHQSIALRHDRRRRRTPELVQFLVVSRVAAEREREIVVERVVVSVRAGIPVPIPIPVPVPVPVSRRRRLERERAWAPLRSSPSATLPRVFFPVTP